MLPKPREDWRLVKDPVHGWINGLDRFSGLAVATNGIMVALRDENEVIRIGHLEWFCKTDRRETSDLDAEPRIGRALPQVKTSAFVDSLLDLI